MEAGPQLLDARLKKENIAVNLSTVNFQSTACLVAADVIVLKLRITLNVGEDKYVSLSLTQGVSLEGRNEFGR